MKMTLGRANLTFTKEEKENIKSTLKLIDEIYNIMDDAETFEAETMLHIYDMEGLGFVSNYLTRLLDENEF